MHRERARDERHDEQHVVAENHVVGDRIERRQQEALEQEMIGVGQRARGGIKDVRVEHRAGENRRRVRQDRLHPPAENPEIEVGVTRARPCTKQRARMRDERPGRDNHCCEVREQRPQPAAHVSPAAVRA